MPLGLGLRSLERQDFRLRAVHGLRLRGFNPKRALDAPTALLRLISIVAPALFIAEAQCRFIELITAYFDGRVASLAAQERIAPSKTNSL